MEAVATVPWASRVPMRRERVGSSAAGRPGKRAQYSSRRQDTNAPSRTPSSCQSGPARKGGPAVPGRKGDQGLPTGFSTIFPESFAGLLSFGIVYEKNARPVAFLIFLSTWRPKVKVWEASSRIGVSMEQR